MTVQRLPQRKGKRITAAGWLEDGRLRYVVYEDDRPAPRVTPAPAGDVPPPRSRRGAFAAEQADLFART